MHRKLLTVMVVVLALSVLVSSCAPAATPTPQIITKIETKVVEKIVEKPVLAKSILIGASYPMTGAETYMYTVECLVQKMAASEINAQGGVLGRPIEIRCIDDAGDPKQAVVVDQQLCDDKEIVCAYAHGYSGCTIPGLPITNKCRLPQITHGSNPRITTLGFDNIFQNLADDSLNGSAAADFLFKEKGVKTVAIIHNKTMFGQGVADLFKARCDQLGIKVTSYQGVDADAPDYSAVLTKIKAEKPDALYTGMYVESARVRKQMIALGMQNVIYMGAELTNTEYMNSVGADGVGAFTCTSAPDREMSDKTKAFTQRCLKAFSLAPEPWNFYAYEGIYIFADAIKRAGSTDREAIIKALRTTDVKGVGMDYNFSFDAKGRLKEPRTFIYECKAPNSFSVVWSYVGPYPQ